MSTPSAPSRFRFSLVTIIVAVNVAGVLIWANSRAVAWDDVPPLMFGSTATHPKVVRAFQYGWPFAMRERRDYMSVSIGSWVMIPRTETRWIHTEWHMQHVAANSIIAVAIVALSCFVTELLVRRLRKAKRHDG